MTDKKEEQIPKTDLKGIDINSDRNDDGYIAFEPKENEKNKSIGNLFTLEELEEEAEAEIIKNEEALQKNQIFNREEFVAYINEYIKSNDKTISGIDKAILKAHRFTTQDNILHYELTSVNQKESLLLIKAQLLDFLRAQTLNKNISLSVAVVEAKEEKKDQIPYSPKEKLKKMQEDYPDMQAFIDAFEFRFKM